MPRPTGFTFERVGDAVHLSHRGRRATTLRGEMARSFLAEVDSVDAQALMARLTGNYKHGNERTARSHLRSTPRARAR